MTKRNRREDVHKSEAAVLASDEKSIPPRPVKARNFRKTAQVEIERSYQKILGKLTEEAASGSLQHTKLLFDLGGVKEEVAEASKRKKKASPSLGKILIKEAERMRKQMHEQKQDMGGI